MKIPNMLIAGILAGISIAIPFLWFLSFIAMSIFFYGLWFQIDNKKHAILSGLLFGFATVGASIWWLWDAIPITWIDVGSPITQWFMVFITWSFISIILSASTSIYSFLIWKFRTNLFIPVISVLAWPLQEIGRELIFTFVTLGKQSLLGAHFSISALGYTLTENNYLLQLADTVGIYGLSFVVALIGSVIALLIYSILYKEKFNHFLISLTILLIVLSSPIWNKNLEVARETLNFVLITSDISLDSDEIAIVIYKKMLEEIASSENIPDVIVFPEGSGLSLIFPNKTIREDWLKQLFGDEEVLVISSNYTQDRNRKTHSLIYYDSSTRGNIATYEKMFLMGQGEYVPYISAPIYKILRNKSVDQHFSSLGTSMERGSKVKAVPYKNAVIGSLLCSEILSPQLYRDLVKNQNANILINLSHTSWFNGSESLFNKMKQMAKVHAVQNRTYFIQTSNGLPSFVLDSNGETVMETNQGETKIIYMDIPIAK